MTVTGKYVRVKVKTCLDRFLRLVLQNSRSTQHELRLFSRHCAVSSKLKDKMKKLLLVLTISIIVHSQDIVFPENPGQRLDSKNKDDRVPVYAPRQCPENQLLYPGDQKNDWVCDCGPGFIYYPPKDGCFPAYRQGPCGRGQHLVLKKSKIIPECATNPCQDGYATYKTRCYQMGKPNGPCKPYEEGGGIFDVNITTLVVECLKGTDKLSLFNIPKNCPPGSRRDSSNQCRENYNV